MSRPNQPTASALAFRWSYIILPLAILLLSLILATYFYRLLPGEVAWHFKGGSPDRWLSRSAIVLWLLLPQFFFTLVAGAITWGAIRLLTRFAPSGKTRLRAEGILPLMGNMLALPQSILCFAILDIFSYNSYGIRLLPLWVFALIIMVVGGIVLSVFFIRILWQAWKAR